MHTANPENRNSDFCSRVFSTFDCQAMDLYREPLIQDGEIVRRVATANARNVTYLSVISTDRPSISRARLPPNIATAMYSRRCTAGRLLSHLSKNNFATHWPMACSRGQTRALTDKTVKLFTRSMNGREIAALIRSVESRVDVVLRGKISRSTTFPRKLSLLPDARVSHRETNVRSSRKSRFDRATFASIR